LPQVKVFDGPSLTVLGSLLAYANTFKGGVFVAAGDVNGDGVADLITGPGQGGGPNVKVWDGTNGQVLENYMAYDSTFGGGVRVAAKDLNADGVAEIITAQGPGTSASTVKAINPVTKQPAFTAFTPFDSTDLTGASIG
jgi:hypothetical protein